tara:strand:- start:26 stop:439 length:414 start_codon:yes stop_codon:yes gene_type:complete
MSNLKNELEALRYMDLKDKFIELGIGEAFKAGVKKVVLIQQAVDLIEKKSGLPEELTVEEVKAEIVKDEVEAAEVELSEFDKAVQAVISTDGIWTKETISKRIVVLGNIFLQHRSTIKGTESLAKQKVLEAASKLMF